MQQSPRPRPVGMQNQTSLCTLVLYAQIAINQTLLLQSGASSATSFCSIITRARTREMKEYCCPGKAACAQAERQMCGQTIGLQVLILDAVGLQIRPSEKQARPVGLACFMELICNS